MTRKPFMPTARQANFVITAGFLALGLAFYMRYMLIQQPLLAQACAEMPGSLTCASREAAVVLFRHYVFGGAALVIAALNFMRPSVPLFTLALMLTAAGVVLYNVELASVAAGLLILSFARPQLVEA